MLWGHRSGSHVTTASPRQDCNQGAAACRRPASAPWPWPLPIGGLREKRTWKTWASDRIRHSLNYQVWCMGTWCWLTGQDRNMTQSARLEPKRGKVLALRVSDYHLSLSELFSQHWAKIRPICSPRRSCTCTITWRPTASSSMPLPTWYPV